MCIYVRPLADEERRHVQALLRSSDAATYRHARVVLLSSQGMKVSQVMQAVGLSDRRIRDILHRFNQHGVRSLPRRKAPGRKGSVRSGRGRHSSNCCGGRPPSSGSRAASGRAPTSRQSPSSRGSPRRCRRARPGGRSIGQATAGSKPSAGRRRNRSTREKRRLVRWVERAQADPAWGLEYEDETWFVWVPPAGIRNPEAGQGWAPAGKPPRNRATRSKGQETFTAYISLDTKEARLHWGYFAHTNQWATAAYLAERVMAHERLGHRVLVVPWDPAPWHQARYLMGWIRQQNRRVEREGHGVKLVPVELPKGAFWLNRVDAIIRQTKGRVLPCRQFANQQEQRSALDRHWLHRNLRSARAPKPEDFLGHLH